MRSWADYQQTARAENTIFDAIRNGNIQMLKDHISNKGDVNLTNLKGHSLLMLAAYNGHEQLAALLIEHGANVNSRDLSGSTILMGVAFKGHIEIAQRLLAAGADPTATNSRGQDALMYAEAFGREQMVHILRRFRSSSQKGTPRPRIFRQTSAFFQILSSILFKFRTKGA